MKKRNNILGILILIAGIAIIALALGYGNFVHMNTPQYFNPKKKHAAETLYSKIMSVDLINNYPRTPDEVAELNFDIIRLIYGDMIVDESLYETLVEQQRRLFSRELVMQNPLADQVSNIKEAVASLGEQGISCNNIVQLPTIYNALDTNICYIRMEQQFSNMEIFYWEYHLEKNDTNNRWEIIRWDMTDESYNIIT